MLTAFEINACQVAKASVKIVDYRSLAHLSSTILISFFFSILAKIYLNENLPVFFPSFFCFPRFPNNFTRNDSVSKIVKAKYSFLH